MPWTGSLTVKAKPTAHSNSNLCWEATASKCAGDRFGIDVLHCGIAWKHILDCGSQPCRSPTHRACIGATACIARALQNIVWWGHHSGWVTKIGARCSCKFLLFRLTLFFVYFALVLSRWSQRQAPSSSSSNMCCARGPNTQAKRSSYHRWRGVCKSVSHREVP